MDESQKKKSFDAIITAINMAAMGAGIAAAVIAANKSKAASAPAKEVVYAVKGVLYAEGEQTDIKEFELKIRQ